MLCVVTKTREDCVLAGGHVISIVTEVKWIPLTCKVKIVFFPGHYIIS